MTQLELTPPAVSHSRTSCAAAESMRPFVKGQNDRVLAWVKQHGPCADEDIAAGTGLREGSARRSRVWLVDHGYIEDSGKTKIGSSGRPCTLWAVL